MSKAKKVIECNIDGEYVKLTVDQWSDVTGSTIRAIWYRLGLVEKGERDWSMRQVVGLDSVSETGHYIWPLCDNKKDWQDFYFRVDWLNRRKLV